MILLHAPFNSSSEIINGGAIRKHSGANKNQSVINPYSIQRSITFLFISKLSNSSDAHKPAVLIFLMAECSICCCSIFSFAFTDDNNNKIDLTDYINFEIRDFLDQRIKIIYVDELPDDQKYVLFNGESFKRKSTSDIKILRSKIEDHKLYKAEELLSRKKLLRSMVLPCLTSV